MFGRVNVETCYPSEILSISLVANSKIGTCEHFIDMSFPETFGHHLSLSA